MWRIKAPCIESSRPAGPSRYALPMNRRRRTRSCESGRRSTDVYCAYSPYDNDRRLTTKVRHEHMQTSFTCSGGKNMHASRRGPFKGTAKAFVSFCFVAKQGMRAQKKTATPVGMTVLHAANERPPATRDDRRAGKAAVDRVPLASQACYKFRITGMAPATGR